MLQGRSGKAGRVGCGTAGTTRFVIALGEELHALGMGK